MAEDTRPSTAIKKWLDEISLARKREKDWRKEGRRILEIYAGKKKDEIPFNILYSNTETLHPALFGASPRPVVQRRFKDEDPLGKAASQAGQRVLEFLLDTNSEEYAPFNSVIEDAVLDGLLPGRGCSIIKYDSEEGQVPDPSDPTGKKTTPIVTWETICVESVEWDRIVIGYSRKWSKVPWIAIEYHVDKDEATRLFGTAKAAVMRFEEGEDAQEDPEDKKDSGEKLDDRKTALIWKIWDRDGGRRILFIAPTYAEGFLKEEEDNLNITGFFPMPEPLRLLRKSNDQLPTAPYTLYENQATELNRITVRINRIVEALKVRGIYDSALGTDITNIFEQDDNKLIPATNVAALQVAGLEKAIWLVPLEKLITVLQQLVIAREQCKRVIYEITGIADIIRGSSVASETATAQQIKDKWSTLRLKRMQAIVQRYVREMLRIMLEVAAKKFSERTFASMTGLPFPTMQQKQQAQQIIMASQQTGQPPDPNAMRTVQTPTWEDVLGTLKDRTQRMYKIDIETNSTVDPEATEDQKNIQEVLTAAGQFLQGVTPLVQSGSMPFQVAQAMLLTIVRRFRFGVEIEDMLKGMQPPRADDGGKQAAAQAKMAQDKQAHDHEMRMKNLEFEQKQQDNTQKAADSQREAAMKEREHLLRMAELDRKGQLAEQQHILKVEGLKAQVAAARAMPKKNGGKSAST